jgi:hypothetical protein
MSDIYDFFHFNIMNAFFIPAGVPFEGYKYCYIVYCNWHLAIYVLQLSCAISI